MENEKTRIEKIQDKLYSRNFKKHDPNDRSGFEKQDVEVNSNWNNVGPDIADLISKRGEEHEERKVFKKILWGSIAFFLLSLGIAAYMFFGGGNTVSSGNIDVAIVGPTTVSGGDTLNYSVIIRNRNNVELQSVVLQVEYPSGTRKAGDLSTELLRERIPLDNIPTGGKVERDLSAAMFGEKDSVKQIIFTLEYRLKDSNALFSKQKNYEIGIKSSPVILLADYPKEVTSGQEIPITLSIVSNTSETLNNVLLNAEFPFGFSTTNPDPAPSFSNNVWNLGSIESGGKKVVKIKGVLQGQNEEERTFRFSTGIAGNKDPNKIGSEFTALQGSISIKRPFLGLVLNLGGTSDGDFSAKSGEQISANLVWSNNLPSSVYDVSLEVKLSGSALDRNSIAVLGGGFYRSVDNTIVWDKNDIPELKEIAPGAKGAFSFSFATLANLSTSQRNQEIILTVVMKGSQVQAGATPISIESQITRSVKIASALTLTDKATRSTGPFENMGPIPPKADNKTTYTIIWTLTNSLNDISGTIVKATVPNYISWEGLTSPESEKISYNPTTREIIWNAGDIKGGAGITSSSRQVSFQIGLTPSLSQVGLAPTLLSPATVTGTDKFTSKDVVFSKPEITTRSVKDADTKENDAVVVK